MRALAFALLAALPALASAQKITPQMPVTPRMYAVKLAVRDFQRTTQFYTLLGMKAGPRHNEWEWELNWDDPARGSSIIMVRADSSARFHVTPGGETLIMSVPDVHAAIARLRGAGFSIPGEPRVTAASAILMIQDPDGDWIELAGPASGAPSR